MASFNYYLVNRRNKKTGEIPDKNVPIQYSFYFDGERLKNPVGERINRSQWDAKKQRVKSGRDRVQINERLESFKSRVEKIYRDAKILGISVTKKYILDKLKENESSKKSILEFFDQYIENGKLKCAANTNKSRKTAYNHFKNYLEHNRRQISFDDFNIDVFEDFEKYLITKCNHTHNTIAKNMTVLKSFLNWAAERGYNKNLEFKKYSYSEVEGEIHVLTWEELKHLYHLKIDKPYLERVRDIFCFSCFTSLRYSDIANLKKSDIKNDTIRIQTIKTNDILDIPLNDYSKALLKKYNNIQGDKCFPMTSNQKMNKFLKELGKLAELNSIETDVYKQAGNRIEKFAPKHEILTFHMGRKTFITNAFRMGIPSELIMKISGHKDHKIMRRYNQIAQEQVKDAMKKFSFENE